MQLHFYQPHKFLTRFYHQLSTYKLIILVHENNQTQRILFI